MPTPEWKVKAAVKALLKAKGIWYCMPIGTGYGNSGVPDFLCCWEGLMLAIETKAPGRRKNLTEMQKVQIEGIRGSGGAALVIDDVAQLEDYFNAHKT